MAFLQDRAHYQMDRFLRGKMEKQHASTEDFSCLIGSYSNNNKNVLSFFFSISEAASFLMFQKKETSADNLQAQNDSPNELATTV